MAAVKEGKSGLIGSRCQRCRQPTVTLCRCRTCGTLVGDTCRRATVGCWVDTTNQCADCVLEVPPARQRYHTPSRDTQRSENSRPPLARRLRKRPAALTEGSHGVRTPPPGRLRMPPRPRAGGRRDILWKRVGHPRVTLRTSPARESESAMTSSQWYAMGTWLMPSSEWESDGRCPPDTEADWTCWACGACWVRASSGGVLPSAVS